MGNLSSFSENCRVSSLMCVYIHKFSKNMVNFSPPPARHEYSQGYSNIYSNNYISGDGIRVSNGPRPDARRRKKERKRHARFYSAYIAFGVGGPSVDRSENVVCYTMSTLAASRRADKTVLYL